MYEYEKIITDKHLPIKLQHFFIEKEEHAMHKHWHKSLEIIIPVHGTVKLWINGKQAKVKRGDIYIINSRDVHQMYWIEDTSYYEGYCLQIDYQYMLASNPRLKYIYFNNPKDKRMTNTIIRIIDVIVRAYNKHNENTLLYIESHILLLLYVLCENLGVYQDDQVKEKSNDKRIHDIVSYMEIHYYEDLTIESIANHFHLSTRYLSTIFKEQLGISPKEYLTRYRLKKAEESLVETNYTIIDIAMSHGFSNLNSFFREFKKHYGQTPLQYRKMNVRFYI